jgi:hypothetical protein
MNGDKSARPVGTAIHEALLCGVSVTFDGGKTFEEIGTITPELWDLIEPIKRNTPGLNKPIQIYASPTLRETFHLKAAKYRPIRQKPPFWSAYK